jgi:putative ATP-grasp target RiPP
VSFGYGTLNRLPENGTLDLTGVTYDPVRGLNLDTSGEPMTLMPITMASSTKANTTEDHQTWTDSDTD